MYRIHSRESLAICSADKAGEIISCRLTALCADVSTSDTPPDWVELMPAGLLIEALDGRKWINSDPQGVVGTFNADPRDLPIDWEHSTQEKAPFGEEAPAAGWITALELRDGAVWAQVKWTPRGAADLASKEYRYISPAFKVNENSEIMRIVSAGLTNNPAMHLQVMAARDKDAGPELATQEGKKMDPKLLAMLGLKVDASDEEVLDAVTLLKGDVVKTEEKLETTEAELETARSKNVDLTKFIPRADYDKVTERALAAEQKITETATAKAAAEATAHTAEVETVIASACKDGKIAPSSKEFYTATCADAAGLDAFRAFVKDAPVIGGETKLGDKKPEGAADGEITVASLTEDQLKISKNCGRTPEQYVEYLKKNKS